MMHFLSLIDMRVLEFTYDYRVAPITEFFLRITSLGKDVAVIAIMILVSILLGAYKKYADIAGLWVSVLGSGAVALVLKVLIHRPRPSPLLQAYMEGPYYSFPSAHATLSMALYGFLFYLLLQIYPTTIRRIAIAVLPIIIMLVSFSRLYLGVHYLSDVLAGLILGGIFVWLGIQTRLYALTRSYSPLVLTAQAQPRPQTTTVNE